MRASSWAVYAERGSPRALKDGTVLENYGVLRLVRALGVPQVAGGRDQRWIDNHGTVICRDVRFGGEGGGFTRVVNLVRLSPRLCGPRVILEGCVVCALGNSRRACAVFCEEIPNLIAVRDYILCGVKPILLGPELNVQKALVRARPGTFRLEVEGNVGEVAQELPEELKKAKGRGKPLYQG